MHPNRKRIVFCTAALLSMGTLLLPGRIGADEPALERWRSADLETEQMVLALARRAFDTYVTRREVLEPPAMLPEALQQRMGVFVSAMRNGAPRCCMGTVYPLEPNTAREIIANAVSAAGRDRRFKPIQPNELKSLILIVSFVGSPRSLRASEVRTLDPAREGLMVKAGNRYGVVLSRETTRVERMVAWGRTRAGVGPDTPVEYFHLDDVRFVERLAANERK
jgi:AMMECR1 domain-containing protein